MGRVGAAGDNAAIKSFVSVLRKNVFTRRYSDTRERLRIAIVISIERTYNPSPQATPTRPVDSDRVRDDREHASQPGCVTNIFHLSV